MTTKVRAEIDWTKGVCAPLNIPAGMIDEDWFADRDSKANRARREAAIKACRTCPLMAECRVIARTRREEFGIWGGEDAEQRHEHLHPSPLVPIGTCEKHGTEHDTYVHKAKGTVVQYCSQCRIEAANAARPRQTHCPKHGTKKSVQKDLGKKNGTILRCPDCAREGAAAGRRRRQALGLTTAGKPRSERKSAA